ncbi:MAG: ABC transporter ATP-binding protein [Christensenellales bacterium]|jgi:branched-chain amino acid transport system ATP-binding protein
MLKVENVTLRFGDLVANNDVSLEVPDQKIVALIGPNGAGKTTCFNCINGVYTPNEGRIILDDVDITGKRPYQIHNMGISRTYQIINLFADMSVIENVIVGMHDSFKSHFFDSMFHTKRHRREEKAAFERAFELLEFIGLKDKADYAAGSLPYGEQRLLEIVRALASSPSLLLLDEPAAGMNTKEKNDLDVIIKKIMQRWQLSILMVEHDMDLVMGISEYIYVLNYGKLLAQGTSDEIQRNPDVIEAYLGGDD